MAKIGLGLHFFYVSVFFVSFTFLVFVLLYYKLFNGFEVKESNYRHVLGSALKFMRSISFLPFLCIFISVQKYSTLPETSVYVYGNVSSKSIKVEYAGSWCTLWIGILVILVIMSVSFQYDQFLTRHHLINGACAHTKIEFTQFVLLTALCYSNFYIHDINQIIHLSICFIIGITLCGSYLYYLPFYSLFFNFKSSFCFLILT